MQVIELQYSATNTYLITGERGSILFDTGWAGTFQDFCSCIGKHDIRVQDISYILISHFHPDHCGIAQQIADLGPVILAADVQREFLHAADPVFEKEKRRDFVPIRDDKVKVIPVSESRAFLKTLGINGTLYHTPGHSDDSISLYLDDGTLFVGDLNPLYELELHQGTQIGESWEKLLSLQPEKIYYGHARPAVLNQREDKQDPSQDEDLYFLTKKIMHYIDKGTTIDKIQKKTGADRTFIEDVMRMYLTHTNVGVRGILDRIEIKGR